MITRGAIKVIADIESSFYNEQEDCRGTKCRSSRCIACNSEEDVYLAILQRNIDLLHTTLPNFFKELKEFLECEKLNQN